MRQWHRVALGLLFIALVGIQFIPIQRNELFDDNRTQYRVQQDSVSCDNLLLRSVSYKQWLFVKIRHDCESLVPGGAASLL